MLQIHILRQNPDFVIERLKVKNFDASELITNILALDEKKRENQVKLDATLSEANKIAKTIGEIIKSGKQDQATQLKERSVTLKAEAKTMANDLELLNNEINSLLLQIPNIPGDQVPQGKTAEDNEIVFSFGKIPTLSPSALPHWDLIKKYDIIDFELGNKVTGAGFPFYRGKGAKLQRALINFFLDEGLKAGYTEFQPPLLVNEASAYGTGQLPDKDGQMYNVGLDKFYLIPTAEVPLTNIYRDTILKESDLPIKNIAYSNCFRREAGSWGADVRGLNRLHQFDKVEIVQIATPETSYQVLEEMREYVSTLLVKLELPFRIVKLCGGDISFTSAMTYDFEVYSAAQKRWLEVSSVSNFESFQANRMKLRFKNKNGKTELAHTLNGSALALPRIVAALLENNQNETGIKISDSLIPYTGFKMID